MGRRTSPPRLPGRSAAKPPGGGNRLTENLAEGLHLPTRWGGRRRSRRVGVIGLPKNLTEDLHLPTRWGGRRRSRRVGVWLTRGRGGALPAHADSNSREAGILEQRLPRGGEDVRDERVGLVGALRQEQLADRIVGDHVLGVGYLNAFDLAVGDHIAVIDDAGIGLAKRHLAQDAGDLLFQAGRVNRDSRFGKDLLCVVAGGNRRISEDDDQTGTG